MERTFVIDGKEVKFKFTLSAFYIFKNQFGYDAMTKIVPAIGELMAGLDFKALSKKDITNANLMNTLGDTLQTTFNVEIVDFLNLIWCFAKTADDSIKEPIKWFNDFEEFPIFDVMKDFLPALMESLASKKKLIEMTDTTKTEAEKK